MCRSGIGRVAIATAWFAAVAALPAQAPRDARRVELDARFAKEVGALARSAASQKLHSLARELATIVVEQYAPDDTSARKLIGQKKVKGEWQSDGTTPAADAANERARSSMMTKWRELQRRIGEAHRDLGLALRGEGADVAVWRPEIEFAVRCLPKDRACHEALGHRQIDGYWGTAEQVAVVERFHGVLNKAAELRDTQFASTALSAADMPIELQRAGLTLYGARSEHYTYWTTGTQENADNLVAWSERCHELLQHLLGERAALVRGESWKWHVVLRSPAERDALLTNSPNTRGPFTLDQAQLFVGIGFASEAGGRAAATWEPETVDEDYAVANVTKRHLLDLRNDGLGEGLVHAVCWLLSGTCSTYFADLAKTSAGGEGPIRRDPNLWFERLWDDIDAGRDQPLDVVARERADNFRDATRIKSWSFMLWMLAAHPDRWMPLIDAVSIPELRPADVDKAFLDVFGTSVREVETEWREWARRGSALGEASGWRPSK